VQFVFGNANKSGDIAVEVQQRVRFDGGLVLPESGPRKQRQAQSVQTLLYVEADRIMGVLRAAERFRIRT